MSFGGGMYFAESTSDTEAGIFYAGLSQGGGFMAGGGLNDSMNSGKSPAGRTVRQQRNIIPVTIRQLQQAIAASPADAATKDQPFQIDGRDCFHFKIVAVIADATPATTHVALTLEDSTGQCNLKEWNNKSELEWAQHKEMLTQGTYVTVVGTVKALNSGKTLMSNFIAPVKDTNEITHHMMSALYAHLVATKGALSAPGQAPGMTATFGAGASAGGFNPSSTPAVGGTAVAATPGGAGMNDVVSAAFNELGTSDEGASIQAVAAHLSSQGKQIDEAQLRQIVDSLSMQGLLYSTVDENHFASTL